MPGIATIDSADVADNFGCQANQGGNSPRVWEYLTFQSLVRVRMDADDGQMAVTRNKAQRTGNWMEFGTLLFNME